MYKLLFSTLCLLALCSYDGLSQEWMKVYGGPGSEQGKFIEPTADGGFLVGGMQSATTQGPTRYWVSRYDSTGEQLWQRTYGRTGLTHTLFAFSTTSDAGFMIGGFTGVQFSGTESALMYRADSLGNERFNVDIDYRDSDHWHLLLEKPDGGYYLGGHTDSKDDPSGDMWLVRMDSARQIIWEKTYDRNTAEHAHGGILTSDGGALMLGHAEAGGREKFWGVKVDSNGTLQWNKVYGSDPNYHDSPYKVFETREGNFAFIGGSGHPSQDLGTMWLLVVDRNGEIVLDKHYGDASGSSFSWSGRQTSDGGYILAGHTNYRTQGQLDMWIVKTDSAGNLQWEDRFGSTGYDYGFDIVEVADGYVATGFTGSPSLMTGGGGDMFLVKLSKADYVLPSAFVLVSPSNGATDVSTAPQLQWSAATNAARYQFQVDEDSLFSSPLFDFSTVTSTSRFLSGLAPEQRYFWRVRAINDIGSGPWTETWSFTVGTPTSVPLDGVLSASSLSIVPNPASGRTTLDLELPAAAHVRVALYDLHGRMLRSVFDERVFESRRSIDLDLAGVPTGIYVVRMEIPGSSVVRTLRLTVVR